MEVAVSALRAELKSWLERAREGEDVVVTERGVPVARLVPVDGADLLTGLIRDGLLTAPTQPREHAEAAVRQGPQASSEAPRTRDGEPEQRGRVTGLVRRLRR